MDHLDADRRTDVSYVADYLQLRFCRRRPGQCVPPARFLEVPSIDFERVGQLIEMDESDHDNLYDAIPPVKDICAARVLSVGRERMNHDPDQSPWHLQLGLQMREWVDWRVGDRLNIAMLWQNDDKTIGGVLLGGGYFDLHEEPTHYHGRGDTTVTVLTVNFSQVKLLAGS